MNLLLIDAYVIFILTSNGWTEERNFVMANEVFIFDALYAFQDQELVMDFRLVETQIGEKLFPIGTVEPDGISYASESKKIYTLFKNSAFLSGDCIENYLNMLFLHEYKPQQIIQSVLKFLFCCAKTMDFLSSWIKATRKKVYRVARKDIIGRQIVRTKSKKFVKVYCILYFALYNRNVDLIKNNIKIIKG